MKKQITVITMWAFMSSTYAQTAYDSSTLVDTNSTSTSTSTVNTNSTNTNNTTVDSTSNNTSTNTNYNVNSGTQTLNNNNNNVSTSDNINRNINSGDMTNRNFNDNKIEQRVIQPPPTAIAPAMMSGGNNDLCTTGTSGAVQTQILGVSAGSTVRDMNCERLKLSKTLYDMGMKVAAVATMCQDRRVFDAMMSAGTPCPAEGQIGEVAKIYWEQNPDKIPKIEVVKSDDTYKKMGLGALLGAIVYKLFGF
jgi:hypothetical protein